MENKNKQTNIYSLINMNFKKIDNQLLVRKSSS